MTLPVSGQISLLQIQDEYLAPRGTGLASLYRGGAYVANTAPNQGVPTSGAINLQSFYGGSRVGPLSAGSSNVFGSTGANNVNDVVGNSVIQASGGVSPYTYSTAYVSGTNIPISSGTATTSTPQFFRSGRPPAGTVSGIFRCTVTDSASTVTTTDFTVTDNRI